MTAKGEAMCLEDDLGVWRMGSAEDEVVDL
jgi:hypothetical protein